MAKPMRPTCVPLNRVVLWQREPIEQSEFSSVRRDTSAIACIIVIPLSLCWMDKMRSQQIEEK